MVGFSGGGLDGVARLLRSLRRGDRGGRLRRRRDLLTRRGRHGVARVVVARAVSHLRSAGGDGDVVGAVDGAANGNTSENGGGGETHLD